MKDFKTHILLKIILTKDIDYHHEGKWLVLDCEGSIHLSHNKLSSLPDYIKFNNSGYVSLANNRLTSLPNHIEFNNNGDVYLYNNPLESLPENIDTFYDKLDDRSLEEINKKFPDHWVVNKERFNL